MIGFEFDSGRVQSSPENRRKSEWVRINDRLIIVVLWWETGHTYVPNVVPAVFSISLLLALTRTCSKYLIYWVGRFPIIMYGMESITKASIRDIMPTEKTTFVSTCCTSLLTPVQEDEVRVEGMFMAPYGCSGHAISWEGRSLSHHGQRPFKRA